MEFVPDLPYGSEPLRLGMASSFAAITDWLHNLDEHARDLLGFEHVPAGTTGVAAAGPPRRATVLAGWLTTRAPHAAAAAGPHAPIPPRHRGRRQNPARCDAVGVWLPQMLRAPYATAVVGPAHVSCGTTDNLDAQLILAQPGSLRHTIHTSDGVWESLGDVRSQSSGGPATVRAASCVGAGGQLHVMVVGEDGQLYYINRKDNGVWQDGFGAVRGVSTGGPANFAAISCGSYDNRTAQVVGIGDDGRLHHTVRHQDGTWQATMGALAAVSLDGAAAYSSIGAVGAGAGVPPAPPSPPVPTAPPGVHFEPSRPCRLASETASVRLLAPSLARTFDT